VASSIAAAKAEDVTVVHQDEMHASSKSLGWELADSRKRVNLVIPQMLASHCMPIKHFDHRACVRSWECLFACLRNLFLVKGKKRRGKGPLLDCRLVVIELIVVDFGIHARMPCVTKLHVLLVMVQRRRAETALD